MLADGMGGHMSGDVASALIMSEVFAQLKINTVALDTAASDISAILAATATAANDRINQYTKSQPASDGMGATLLATLVRGDDLYWISIGDSPLYLFRDGELTQLNQDHSMAPQIDMMVKVGAMSEDIGRNHPDRNTLTSAITGNDIARIDCPQTPTSVRAGDIIIVASDGLQYLSNDRIAAILTDTYAQPSVDISGALLAAVHDLDDPDQDNAAFSVIKLGGQQQIAQPQSAPRHDPVPLQNANPPKPAPLILEAVATQPAPVTATAGAETAQSPIDMQTRRMIRLVTSQTREFDKPAMPAEISIPVEEAKPKGHTGWLYRRRTSQE